MNREWRGKVSEAALCRYPQRQLHRAQNNGKGRGSALQVLGPAKAGKEEAWYLTESSTVKGLEQGGGGEGRDFIVHFIEEWPAVGSGAAAAAVLWFFAEFDHRMGSSRWVHPTWVPTEPLIASYFQNFTNYCEWEKKDSMESYFTRCFDHKFLRGHFRVGGSHSPGISLP